MTFRNFVQFPAALLFCAALHASPLGNPELVITGPGNGGVGQDIILVFQPDNTIQASGQGDGYSYSIYGDADPILNYTFGASTPGHHSFTLFLPVVPGPYNIVRNIASLSMSDGGLGTSSTSVTNLTINGQVPDGNTLPGLFIGGGPFTIGNGVSNGQGFSQVEVSQFFLDPNGMRINVEFDLVDPDLDGSAAITGQLILLGPGDVGDEVPEPKTSMLIGLGLIGVAAFKPLKRRFNN